MTHIGGRNSEVSSGPETLIPKAAADDLASFFYHELHEIARREYHFGGRPQTLQATALIGEVYLKMHKRSDWASEGHFLGCAATAMRNFMVDAARARLADKRGGKCERVTDAVVADESDSRDEELVRLHIALQDLSRHDADLAKLVEYRFFMGLDEKETAQAMNVSDRTVRRWWTRAKAWIYSSMTDSEPA